MAKKKKKKQTGKHVPHGKITTPDYVIYTDGGCLVNPCGPGGYGYVIINKMTGQSKQGSGGFRRTTNNRMEIMAAIKAIRLIPQGASLLLYSDSQYLINTYTEKWAMRKNQDLFKELFETAKGKSIEMCWIRGHHGYQYNEICDKLATKEMYRTDLPRDEGYENEKAAGRAFFKKVEEREKRGEDKAGAMGMEISVPPEFDTKPNISDRIDYAREHHIHPGCANAIRNFCSLQSPRFRDYMDLKTGGMDDWSNATISKLKEYVGEKAVSTVRAYLQDERDVKTALRWRCRGLPLSDCIRKVFVDLEVAENCR